MGCGCAGRTRAAAGGFEILGYRVIRPDGTVVPPVGQPPFFSTVEARAEQRAAGGGTIERVDRKL